MANTMTFNDMTIELKQANISLGRIDDNTNLTNEFLNLSIDTFKQGFSDMLSFFKGNSLANIEREREQSEFNKDMLAALQDLKPKYAGPDKAAVPQDSEFGLGGLLTGLAIAIGAIVGVIKGQLQAIKLFAKALMPVEWIDKIRKVFTSFVAGLSMQFDLLKASMMEKLASVGKFLASTFDDVAKFFSGESKIFSGLKNVFTTLFQPFKELFSMVKGLLAGPFAAVGNMFSSIGKTLSGFGAMVGKVAGIVGKLFLPLTIIITVWDTVKGMIEGFQKDGIIGAIGGAIKGFFNSLIFGPIDMLKDATAWVLGFFGFDKAKEFLKSFSFEKTFSAVIDAIMSPIETLKNIVGGVVTFFTDIGNKISGFFTNFEIPGFSILGKKFGPWKPFSASKEETGGTATVTQSPTGNGTQPAAKVTKTATTSVTTATTASEKYKTVEQFAIEEARKFGRTVPNIDDKETAQMLFNEQQQQRAKLKPSQTSTVTAPTTGGTAGVGAIPSVAAATAPSTQTATAPSSAAAPPQTMQTAQAPTTGGRPGVGAVPSAAGSSTGKAVAAPSDAGPNWKASVSSYKESTPVDHLERQYPGVSDKFRELASSTKPRTDSFQSIQSHEQELKLRALSAIQSSNVAPPAQAGMAVQSGAQLQSAAQEKNILQSMPAMGGGAGGSGGGVQQNNSTTVVNNSTVVVKPIPAASRRPNNSEDIFFGRTAGYA